MKMHAAILPAQHQAYRQATDTSITGKMGNATYSNDKNSDTCFFPLGLSLT
jgi:hypothetical protein